MGNEEGIRRRDQVIAELRNQLDMRMQGQTEEELYQALLADYDSACAVIQELHIKNNSLEAKNADACNTISDLLAQTECLQVANRNLCARNETLQERVKNSEEVNMKHIENEDILRKEKQIILEKRERSGNALFETQAAILKLQRKVEKLKKKNKFLAKATLC